MLICFPDPRETLFAHVMSATKSTFSYNRYSLKHMQSLHRILRRNQIRINRADQRTQSHQFLLVPRNMRTGSSVAVANALMAARRPVGRLLVVLSLLLCVRFSRQALPPFDVPPAEVQLLSPRGFSASIPGSTDSGILVSKRTWWDNLLMLFDQLWRASRCLHFMGS